MRNKAKKTKKDFFSDTQPIVRISQENDQNNHNYIAKNELSHERKEQLLIGLALDKSIEDLAKTQQEVDYCKELLPEIIAIKKEGLAVDVPFEIPDFSESNISGDDKIVDTDYSRDSNEGSKEDNMEETDTEKHAYKFDCPVCGKIILDFGTEEYFIGRCSHVVLSYSDAMQEFGEIDESMEEVVAELEERLADNEEHEEDDDYEEITMIELIEEYAQNSNGQYELYSIDDPNSVPPLYETIYLLIKMIDGDESDIVVAQRAIEKYSEAIRRHPNDADHYVSRGMTYCYYNQYQRAIEDYSIAIRLQPDYEGLYLNRGLAYQKLGQHKFAIKDYNEALRVDPEDANAYYHKATCLALQNKAEQACKCLRSAMRLGYGYKLTDGMKIDFDNIISEKCFIEVFKEQINPSKKRKSYIIKKDVKDNRITRCAVKAKEQGVEYVSAVAARYYRYVKIDDIIRDGKWPEFEGNQGEDCPDGNIISYKELYKLSK